MRRLRFVVLAQPFAEGAELADVDLAPMAIEQLDEAAHVRPFAAVGQGDAHVDLGDGVLLAALPVEDTDGIAQALDAGAIEREAALVPLGVDIAQLRPAPAQRRFAARAGLAAVHSSSSPRSTVTAAPPIQPRTLPGAASGRTSSSTRPGRPISSPWVKTSLRGRACGSAD